MSAGKAPGATGEVGPGPRRRRWCEGEGGEGLGNGEKQTGRLKEITLAARSGSEVAK